METYALCNNATARCVCVHVCACMCVTHWKTTPSSSPSMIDMDSVFRLIMYLVLQGVAPGVLQGASVTPLRDRIMNAPERLHARGDHGGAVRGGTGTGVWRVACGVWCVVSGEVRWATACSRGRGRSAQAWVRWQWGSLETANEVI